MRSFDERLLKVALKVGGKSIFSDVIDIIDYLSWAVNSIDFQ